MTDVRDVLAYGAFPALSAVGFYTTMWYGRQNGLVKSLSDVASGRVQDLPMTKAKVIKKWTGIKVIDDYLAFYLAFFLPALGRGTPNTTLHGRHFIGQFTAMWTLIQLQANRRESSPLIQASLFLTAFGIQTVAAATVVPIFCALHLATANLGVPGLISESRIAAIPLSVVMSILVPLLTATSAPSPWTRQAAINVWQVFYIFTEIIERAAAPAFARALSTGAISNPLNLVYTFAEGLATITHVATVGAAIATKIVPSLFPKAYAEETSLKTMFYPRLKLEKEGDMIEARLHLLRWDEWVSCGTFLAWATYLYLQSSPMVLASSNDYLMLAGKLLARVLLTGPIGAAAHLLRARDLILMKS